MSLLVDSVRGHDSTVLAKNALKFDPKKRSLLVEALDASEFIGHSIDFRGASVINASLVNATIEDLKHLTVESIGVASLAANGRGNDRMVTVDQRGKITSVPHVRWDESTKVLKVTALSSFGQSNFEMRSNVDFMNHQIANFVVEPGTGLEHLVLRESVIENSVFRNVTAEDLMLGDVAMESVTLKDVSKYSTKGIFLTVQEGGKVVASDAVQQIDGSLLSIEKNLRFMGSVDLQDNSMENVRIKSGVIEGGNITVHVQSVSASSLSMLSVRGDKSAIEVTV